MNRYTGLPEGLRREVFARDNHRCRWCGATNRGLDIHHIRYRRGFSDDVLENLVSLCRAHHSFVHGTPNGAGHVISKHVAQLILRELLAKPGTTGSSMWRHRKRQWALQGLCEHGESDGCSDCGRR